MKIEKKEFHIEGLLALLLFTVFAVCVLSMLLLGAGAYQRLSLRSQSTYDYRTCAQYLATRLRQADGEIRLLDSDGVEGLLLSSTIDGREYGTYIYCWDGWLREFFADKEVGFSPEFGEAVFQAEDLRVRSETADGLLALTLTMPDGGTVPVYIGTRGIGR